MIVEKMRKASAVILYNGENITASLAGRTGSFTYNDPASGSSDDCALTIQDPNELWLSARFPKLGDKIIVSIIVTDWRFPGDDRILNCGSFTIDDPGFSGPPSVVSFRGTSQPAEESFTNRARTQTWENVTVQNIASEIGTRYGLVVLYTADEVKIDSIEQSEQTDSDFLNSVCEQYGLSLKIYDTRLVIYDVEKYRKMPPVAIIAKSSMLSWDFQTTLAGTYTGGKMTYTDPDTGEDVEATVGTDKRQLSVNGKADSQADAEKQIKAAVNKANNERTTLKIRIPGDPDRCSAQCVQIVGLGAADGKYFTTNVSHSIGGKYETTLDLSKVEAEI